MRTSAEVAVTDALARRANGLDAIDMPNGIGFCLYITRACLDAVGPLPELYERGYYEDVEFCLRAQEKNLRNVCATGIYVGHAGARSFAGEKRRLVMRNLRKLKRRFPDHVIEAAAFVEADPLQSARGAIEALAPPRLKASLLDLLRRRDGDAGARGGAAMCGHCGRAGCSALRGLGRGASRAAARNR